MVSVKYELPQNKGLGADQRTVSNCDIFSPLVSPFKIPVEELEDRVFVKCNTSVTWVEGTVGTLLTNNTRLDLGKRILDPRGIYRCNGTDIYKDKESTVQVHYRMCQNCVELDPATLAGIIVTDVIATLLLALGVFCFAGHETGRLSGAADTQALLRNDQVYQPLRDRDDAQYSRLGGNWARNK
ncbi:T-cell surface glycoprotein CD3 delta chain isoform X1 [Theropithecus gelada]|uniref:T-cell surface glycoprotein CD3 delta chain isoform X1 n=1 Tax=Theropithecus gelada TaxID=9565 RepID=UPI000DC18689|nr:T-cell surface glycoprotein CD3 delta chain isoform X1 [Theropithecus gelada]